VPTLEPDDLLVARLSAAALVGVRDGARSRRVAWNVVAAAASVALLSAGGAYAAGWVGPVERPAPAISPTPTPDPTPATEAERGGGSNPSVGAGQTEAPATALPARDADRPGGAPTGLPAAAPAVPPSGAPAEHPTGDPGNHPDGTDHPDATDHPDGTEHPDPGDHPGTENPTTGPPARPGRHT
jgi:hypothetical protein